MKLPPYARPLHDLISSGVRPSNDVYVFTGEHAWEKGKNISISYPDRTIVLPPWLSPFTYYWPVKDCDMLIVDRFSESFYIDEVAICLYEFGARIVHFIDFDDTFITYHKEVTR
jgi:hypothetical protein